MRLGASDLLNNNFGNKYLIADKFVKGELTKTEELFVMDVLTQKDINYALERISQN